MSKSQQLERTQALILTGMSTVVGLLFLAVAGKVVDRIGHTFIADATASVATAPLLQKEIPSVSREILSELPTWIDGKMRIPEWDFDFMSEDQPVKYTKGPRLHSRAAFIVDLSSGEVLWGKAPDTRRAAASLTKVVSSLTLAERDVDLDQLVCTDSRIRTGIAGANTRVSVGDCATGWDFMGAALVSSDNGAAFAFPMVVDEEMSHFATSMNMLATELGMDQSEFVDSAGIYDENITTARDLTRASIAAAFHPTVSIPAASSVWYADIGDDNEVYKTTNRAAGRADFLLAKTGFTYTARANFTAVYQEKDGRKIAFTILGAWSPSRRSKDVRKIMDWVRRHP